MKFFSAPFRRQLLTLATFFSAVAVHAAVTITTQPVDVSVTAGTGATLSVTATGATSYQWRRNSFNISGATAATYPIASASRTDADYYDVVVSDGVTPVTSNVVRLSVAPTAAPTAMAPDPAWNLQLEANGATISATAALSDGGFYAAGTLTSILTAGTPARRPSVFRINVDGTLNTTFVPPEIDGPITALGVQTDGKLVIGGSFYHVAGYVRSRLARLNTDGTLDLTFNPPATFNSVPQIIAIAIQSDGKIIAGGSNIFFRSNPDGSRDASYAPTISGSIGALALDSNGKLVIGGSFSSVTVNGVTTTKNNLARINTDGTLDTAFDIGAAAAGGSVPVVNALVIQSDGSIVVGGSFTAISGATVGRIARFSSSGAIDTAFNTAAAAGFSSTVNTLALDSTQRIVAGGVFSTFAGTSRNNLARLLATGALDTTFTVSTVATITVTNGGTGYTSPPTVTLSAPASGTTATATATLTGTSVFSITIINPGSGYTSNPSVNFSGGGGSGAFATAATASPNVAINTLAISPLDGRILAAGGAAFGINTARASVARYNTDGTLEPSVNFTFRQVGSAFAMAPLTGGKLLVGGFFNFARGAAVPGNLIRVNSDGTVDSAFNTGGAGTNGRVSSLVLLPDGRIAIGGFFNTYNGTSRNLVALVTAAGALDTTYAPSGGITAVTVGSIGTGYITAPSVTISPPSSGTTATATATLNGSGVSSITITNPGSGYTTAPTVILSPPTTGATATATASLGFPSGFNANALALLPGQRLAVGGTFTSYGGVTCNHIAVVKLVDGSLDTTFAPTGTGFGTTNFDQMNALVAQRDGKLLVGGQFAAYNGTAVNNIARLNPDGSLDTAFTTAAGTGFNSVVNSLSVRPDGLIVAGGGFTSFAGVSHSGVNRLLATGTQDTTFTNGGVNTVNAVASLEDGSVVTRGSFSLTAGTLPTLAFIERLTPTGVRDATFTAGGLDSGNLTPATLLVRDDGQFIASSGGSSQGLLVTQSGAAPVIATQPANQSVAVGASASFSVSVTSAIPVSYQWLFNGQPISGAISSSYTVASSQVANVGSYSVIATSELGSVTSSAATLSGTGAVPVFTTQPAATIVMAGAANVTLTAAATGATSYQWRRNGVAIAGATSATYTIATARQTDSDTYDVVAYNGLTPTGSSAAKLTVTPTAFPNGLKPDGAFRLDLDSTALGAGAIRAVAPSGTQFYVAGDFSRIGGVARSRLARFNLDGTLDTTYVPPAFDGSIRALAVQADGKLVVAGNFNSVGGVSCTRVARLKIDGTLDPSFIGYNGTNNTVSALAIQSDGKIIIGGAFTTLPGINRNFLGRLNGDGTPDLSYDAQIGSGNSNSVNALMLLSDGRLVVGGTFTTVAGTARGDIAVLLATGALDTTFAPTGTGFTSGAVNALALDNGGNILVGGSFTSFAGASQNRLARLTLSGALDAALNIGTGIGSNNGNSILAIQPLPGGGFVIGGNFSTYNGTTSLGGLISLNSTGVLTNSFASGVAFSPFAANVIALVLDSAGGLVVGGDFASLAGSPRSRLGRLNPTTAALDPSLNPSSTEFLGSAYAIAAQPGGKFLVMSNATRVGGTAVPTGLFRLNADLTLDTSYNSGGVGITFNNNANSGSNMGLLVAPDGKAYISGPMSQYNGVARANLARVNADGTLDTTFNVGTGFNNSLTAFALLPNSQLLVAGFFGTYNGATVNGIVRLNSDGSRDTSLTVPAVNIGNINAIAPASGGKFYIGGTFTSISAPTATVRNRIARMNADGSLDTSFDAGGGANSTVNTINVMDDGRILIGGTFSLEDNVARNGVARLGTTGVLDRTFGSFLGGSSAGTNSLLVQPDGRILQRGSFLSLSTQPTVPGAVFNTSNSFGLARLTASGAPETTISVNGVSTLSQEGSVILDDGRVLVAHVNPSIANDGSVRAGLTLLIPQVGPGLGALMRPVFATAGVGTSSATVFTANITGNVTYQWRKGGVTLVPAVDRFVGTNSRTLYFANPQAADAGSYDCVVTDGAGTFTTNAFTLTVGAAAPTVQTPSANTNASSSTASPGLTYAEGAAIVLSSGATGTAPLTYQWQRNGTDVVGATSQNLDLGALTSANVGAYTLKVTNSIAPTGVSSSALNLTLSNSSPVAPVIAKHPTQQTALLGGSAFLTVEATGTGSLSYQWKKNGAALSGATAQFYQMANASLADAGLYTVDVSNAVGTVTSNAATVTVGNPSVWTWRQPLPYGGAYNKVAYGAGRYVAVGSGGAISTSTDSILWTLVGQINSQAFLDVVFAAGRFVAVGTGGAIDTSPDGLVWTSHNFVFPTNPVPNGASFSAVIYDGSQYVVVGEAGLVLTSPDSVTWTQRAAPFTYSKIVPTTLQGIAFGGGTYMTVTDNSAFTSTDLVTWTARPLPVTGNNTSARAVIFSGGNFYVTGTVGGFLRSTDGGITWTSGSSDSVNASNSENWVSVATNGTRLVAANGFGALGTSTDGLVWNIVTNFPVNLTSFNGVNFVNGQFLAVGNGGMIFTSPDGLAWTRRTFAPAGLGNYNGVVSGTSGFVAVGNNGQIANSTDGVTWTPRDGGSASSFNAVAFGGSKYVAVQGNIIASSFDGATWTNVATGIGNSLFGVAYDGSQFVAVGNSGRVTTSPDALTWTARTSGQFTSFRGVAAGGGALVAVGDNGLIMRSTDAGVTWVGTTEPASVTVPTTVLRAVTFGGGQFVAVGADFNGVNNTTIILTSPDGSTWTLRSVPFTQSARAIVYANGRYIVGGGTSSILTSADAITWTAETSNNTQLVLGLANSTAGTVAVGQSGSIQLASNSPAPSITSVTPVGSAGGTTVTLAGSGFTGATGVSFNGVAAGSFAIASDTSVTAVTPASFTSGPVTVTGPGGTSLATVAYSFVAVAPSITTQPVSQNFNVGSSVTLTAVATGTAPLTYQWRKGSVAISGATAASYTIANGASGDAGNYTVVVTNSAGTITSSVATLTATVAAVAPSFSSPASQTVNVGDAVTFSVSPSGTAPFSYQWSKNNVAIGGATASSYTLASAQLSDAGSYTVAVTNAANTVTSTAATLTVNVPPPAVVAPSVTAPTSQSVGFATPVSFSVTASGTAPFTYQWFKGTSAIAGATSATYSIGSAQFTDAGSYTVVVTNSANSVTSVAATLAVNATAPIILSAPSSQTVLAGASVSLSVSVSATGVPLLPYVWKKDGTTLAGFTGPSLTISGVSSLDAGSYTVTVANSVGSSTSAAAVLTVNTPPIITASPASQTALVGASVTMTVTATGTGTLSYQWAKDGVSLAGATSATFGLPAVVLGDTGSYSVTVTSAFGSVTSPAALLTVRVPQVAPTITTQPVDASVVAGSTATFTVAAAGSAPLTYQWQKSGINLAGAVGATLTIPNAQAAAAGSYAVVVANNVSSVTSSAANLTVKAPVVAPVVNSAATAAGGLGVPFAYVITATNSPTSFNATGLPAGLTVDTATGVISGTPTAAGTTTITLTATNSAGFGTLALVLTVAQPVPVVVSASSVKGRAGVAFTYASAATNSPTAFAASGLPSGLALDASSGVISGTPTVAGTFTVSLSATNSGGTSAVFPVTLTIAFALTVPVVTSAPTATGKVGDPFSYGITASGTPTSFAASGLPAGLTLSAATGAVTGTPTTAGKFVLNVTATNADGTSAPLAVQITIVPSASAPVITSSSTTGGTAGTALAYAITATNNPTSYSASGLPAGLAFSATTGAISGVPTAPGDFTVALSATNAAGTGSKSLTISIVPGLAAPAISSSSATAGTVGVAFAYSTVATNSPTSFAATGLPAGLALDAASGVISGVPTVAGTFTVKLTATNPGGAGAAFTLTLTISPAAAAPAITSTASASATAGTLFTYQVIASNGPILSYAATGLPSGLAINPASGVVTGTPTVAGLFNVVLTATNIAGSSAPLTLVLNVKPSALSPVVTSPTTATGTQGSAFSYTVTASNMPASVPLPAGNGYAATGLPDGIALNAATGLISGTPTATGNSEVLLTATNDAGTSAPRTLTITIRASFAAPQITSTNSAAATSNSPFSYQTRATNTPTSFDAADRPAWLSVDTSTGILSGTPPVPGTFTATLLASNAAGTGSPVKLTITATPASGSPVVISGLSDSGTAGTAYNYLIAATNSPTSYAASGLPAGLSLNPATGLISGTPAAPGVFRVGIWAVNTVGVGGARSLVLNLAAAVGTPVIGIGSSITGKAVAVRFAEFSALSEGDAKTISSGSRVIAAAAGLTASGAVGESFSYQIRAGGSPTGYYANDLPSGLAINPSTGVVSGVPTVAGIYDSKIGAINALGVGAPVPFTITIQAPASTPVVTSAATAAASVGTAYVYQATASGSPISYNATGLPDGLSLAAGSGVITGTPVAPGVFTVNLSANNAAGTGAETPLTLTIAAAASAPTITGAATATATVGTMFSYQATASGTVTSWSAKNLPAGMDIDTTNGGISGAAAVEGTFSAILTARNAAGQSSPFTLTLKVAPSLVTSGVSSASTANVATGGAFSYQIVAGNSPVSYNATELPAGLMLNSTTGLISGRITTPGTYTFSISANNASGTGPVTAVTVTVSGAVVVAAPPRLANVSTRVVTGLGDQVLISGFIISGTDPRPVLIRAVGPTLSAFGLTGVLADPAIELFRGSTSVATNDDWGTPSAPGQPDAASVAAASLRVGAFTLPSGSKDAVIYAVLNPGSYTAVVRGAGNSSGLAIVEVYDAGDAVSASRIVNLSTRGFVGGADNILIAGLIVSGTQPKQFLIRAAGPSLTQFGISGALADPVLQVFRGSTVIASNDNWDAVATDAVANSTAAVRSGAFGFPAGSRDAAIVLTLDPGAYTVHVRGVGTATGIALVEVYEVP